MTAWIALMLARRSAGKYLGELAQQASEGNLSLTGWRNLVAQAARSGDLDAIYNAYVGPARSRAQAFVNGE